MSQKYFTTLTNIGAAMHANAQLQQTSVPWTHIVLGDGNGVEPMPSPEQTGVIHEVDRLSISSIALDPDNPNWIVIEAVIPADRGGYVVRETALMGGADGNQCIAVGNYPSATKPLLSEGAGSELIIRVVVEIAHTATVTLKIDPAVVIASRDWVVKLEATQLQAEQGVNLGRWLSPLRAIQLLRSAAARASENLFGTLRIATQEEVNAGESDVVAVTPKKIAARSASETMTGLVKLATKNDAESGTDSEKVLTPLRAIQLLRATTARASESLLGTLRVATQAEVNAGTADDLTITPRKLRAGFVFSFGPNGYVGFPIWLGSWLIQWGGVTVNASSSTSILWPTTFPNECYIAVCSHAAQSGGNASIYNRSNTGATVYNEDSNAAKPIHFITVGR